MTGTANPPSVVRTHRNVLDLAMREGLTVTIAGEAVRGTVVGLRANEVDIHVAGTPGPFGEPDRTVALTVESIGSVTLHA